MTRAGRDFDLCAYSDPITDLVYGLEDQRLHGLKRGRSIWIDASQRSRLFAELGARPPDAQCPGGSPTNTLCGASRLGLEGAYIGCLGDDALADAYEDGLRAAGVRSFARRMPGPSSVAVTLIGLDGERSFAVDLGVAAEVDASRLDATVIPRSRLFHTSAYQLRGAPTAVEATRALIAVARDAGTSISLDLGDSEVVTLYAAELRALLRVPVAVLFASEDEARALAGEPQESSIERVAERLTAYADVVALTLGAEGSYVLGREGAARSAALPCPGMVDSNGAGDAFNAGFLCGYLRQQPLASCARLGHRYARLVCGQRGAQLREPNAELAALREEARSC